MTVLAWQRAGAPGGPAVVLVHAWATDGARDWEATGWVARLVAAGFDVLVPDLPGHGESADVALPPEAEPAGWTATVAHHDLAALGAGPVQAVGHAEGCLVASHLAVRAGGTVGVGSLLLLSADDRAGLPLGDEIAAALRDRAARVWHAEAAEAVSAARADRRHHLPTLATWAERATWPAAPRLAALRIPALVGVGAGDERREHAPRLAQLFHDARLVTVPGDRRSVLLAEELLATVTRFLTDHGGAA